MKLSRRKFLRAASGLLVPASLARGASPLVTDLPFLGSKGPSSLLNGIKAYWQLGEATGTTRVDQVSALNLTDNNANEVAEIGLINGTTHQYVHCQTTHASDALLHAANAAFQTGVGVSFTYAGWFAGGIILDHHWLANWDNAANESYLLYCSSVNNSISWVALEAGTLTAKNLNVCAISAMQTAGQPTWHHFAIGYDDGSKVLFCQFDAGTRQTIGCNSVNPTNATFTLGNLSSLNFSQGVLIAELGFWRRALTTNDVSVLYNGGSPITYPFS